MIDVGSIWEMRPRGDREPAKAAGSWMPGDVPRSRGSCCHGPLETLGALALRPTSRPEKLTEPQTTSPRPHLTPVLPLLGQGLKKIFKKMNENCSLFSVAQYLFKPLVLSLSDTHVDPAPKFDLPPLFLPDCPSLSQNVTFSGKHEGQQREVLKGVLGFKTWLSTPWPHDLRLVT